MVQVMVANWSVTPSTAGILRHLRRRRRRRRRQRHHHILHLRRRRRRRRRRCRRRRRPLLRHQRHHRPPLHRSRAMNFGICSVWLIAARFRRPRARRTTRSRRATPSTLACGTWSIISSRGRAARTPRRTVSTIACHRPRRRRHRPHRRCPRRPHHRRPSTSSAITWTSGNPSTIRMGATHWRMRGTV